MRPNRSLMPFVLSIGLGMAACGDAGPGAPDGPAGLDAPDFSIAPVAETLYTVGALDGEPWETFGGVTSVAFDPDGYLYILDRTAAHVVLIGPDGQYVRTISSAGEGPGELGTPFGMVLLSGNRVAVFDFAKQGFQVFDREGEFLESVTFNPQDGMPGGRIWALPDDGIVSAGGMRIRMGPGGPVEQPPGRPIERFGLDGSLEAIYTAWEAPPPEDESENTLEAGGQRIQMRMPRMRAFDPQLHVGILRDGRIALVDSVGYDIKLLDGGTISSTLARGLPPIAVTSEIEDAEKELQLARFSDDGGGASGMVMITRSGGSGGGSTTLGGDAMNQMMRDRVENMAFSPEIPVIQRMAVDWSDRIWVERSALPGEEGPTDILTADGQYLGTIGTDGLRIPAAFGPGGLMAYIESDELEVQRVRVARLQDDEALEGAR